MDEESVNITAVLLGAVAAIATKGLRAEIGQQYCAFGSLAEDSAITNNTATTGKTAAAGSSKMMEPIRSVMVV